MTTVLLFHHDDWRGPGTVGGTDDASVAPAPSPLSEWLGFGGGMAGGAVVPRSQWCAVAVECSPSRPLLG